MKSFGGMQACRAAVCIAMLAGLGPRPVWAGDNVWTSLGPDGGSITALVIDPQNTSTVYAATGNGVFKTTDKGASWTAANAGLPADLIQAVVIDPQNTGTLYASILSHGVFKSKDGGVSWNPAGSGLPTYSSDVTGYQEVPALVIDPRHPDTLYAAIGDDPLSRGIYKTINGGGNWTAVNSGLPSRSPGYNVASLAIDPQDTNLLYAAVDLYSQQQTLNPGVIFRSADGGASWAATAAGLPGFSHYDLGPAPLLIDPRNSSTLYAGTASAGVWKSTDRGTSWFAVNSGVPADYVR